MKKLLFILAVICTITVSAISIPKEYEELLNKGSLYPLKSPKVTADFYFDLSECKISTEVGSMTDLYGSDGIGSENTDQIISDIKAGEEHFFAWFNQKYGKKYCKLIPEGTESPYKIVAKITLHSRHEMNIMGKNMLNYSVGGQLCVIDRANSDTIALVTPFMGLYRENGFKSPDTKHMTKAAFEVLADNLAEKIKKSKAPKK